MASRAQWSLIMTLLDYLPYSRQILQALATICLVITVSLASADPVRVSGPEAVGVFGEGSAMQGEPDNTGAMAYSYTFNLPSARGRPQPQLTLKYNSSAGDREAGYGWGLDLPVIEHKPLSGNPCFSDRGTPVTCSTKNTQHPISDERYTFSGQPLVFICQLKKGTGVQKNCSEEEQPGWAYEGGWRYFRLQVEGLFARFYLSENRLHWRVQLKGGEILDFGEPPDIKGSGVERSRENNGIVRWRLVRHSDAVHDAPVSFVNAFFSKNRKVNPLNYIIYRWKTLQGTRRLLYLTDIYDTPRANGQIDDLSFAHHTQLHWETPKLPQTSYADVHKAVPDLRLAQVAVASMPWSGNGPREIIRTYSLSYDPNLGVKSAVERKSALLNHSLLYGIGLTGRCNLFEDENGNIKFGTESFCYRLHLWGRTFPSPVLPPTTFEYQSANPVFGLASLTKVDTNPGLAYVAKVTKEWVKDLHDMISLPGLNEIKEFDWTIEKEKSVLPYLQSVAVVDFNRDSLPDIVQGWNSQFCPGEGYKEDAIHESIVVAPQNSMFSRSTPNALECKFKTTEGLMQWPIMSTRPIIGYLNKGIGKLSYQCMDAGSSSDGNGLTNHNNGRVPGFLSNKGASTLVGTWSRGVLAWSAARFAAFRARPMLAWDEALGEFKPGKGCDADLLKPDISNSGFQPGWKWERLQSIDWEKEALGGCPRMPLKC